MIPSHPTGWGIEGAIDVTMFFLLRMASLSSAYWMGIWSWLSLFFFPFRSPLFLFLLDIQAVVRAWVLCQMLRRGQATLRTSNCRNSGTNKCAGWIVYRTVVKRCFPLICVRAGPKKVLGSQERIQWCGPRSSDHSFKHGTWSFCSLKQCPTWDRKELKLWIQFFNDSISFIQHWKSQFWQQCRSMWIKYYKYTSWYWVLFEKDVIGRKLASNIP